MATYKMTEWGFIRGRDYRLAKGLGARLYLEPLWMVNRGELDPENLPNSELTYLFGDREDGPVITSYLTYIDPELKYVLTHSGSRYELVGETCGPDPLSEEQSSPGEFLDAIMNYDSYEDFMAGNRKPDAPPQDEFIANSDKEFVEPRMSSK